MAKIDQTVGPLPNAYGPYPTYPEFHDFETNGTKYRFTYLRHHIFEMIHIENVWWGYYFHEREPMKVGGTIQTKKWKDLNIAFTLKQL